MVISLRSSAGRARRGEVTCARACDISIVLDQVVGDAEELSHSGRN